MASLDRPFKASGTCHLDNPRQIQTGYKGLVHIVNGHPAWTGKVAVIEHKITEPLGWRKPRRIFVDSMSDLFHEEIPNFQRDRIFATMVLAHWHTFQVLTKRAEIMEDYWNSHDTWIRIEEIVAGVLAEKPKLRKQAYDFEDGPPMNIWLGVSVEDKLRLARIHALRRTEAYMRFISFEPLLEDLGDVDLRDIDWAIIGGESGHGARPMDVAWPRSLLRQCREQDVAGFMKQVGARPFVTYRTGAPRWPGNPTFTIMSIHEPLVYPRQLVGLKDKKGGNPEEWPSDLRVRTYPK